MVFFFTHAFMAGSDLKDSWQWRTIYIRANSAPKVSVHIIWFPRNTALIYCLFRPHSLKRAGMWLCGAVSIHTWRFNRVAEDFDWTLMQLWFNTKACHHTNRTHNNSTHSSTQHCLACNPLSSFVMLAPTPPAANPGPSVQLKPFFFLILKVTLTQSVSQKDNVCCTLSELIWTRIRVGRTVRERKSWAVHRNVRP